MHIILFSFFVTEGRFFPNCNVLEFNGHMFVFPLKNPISFHSLSIDSLTSKQFAQKLINDFTSQEEERVNTSGSNGCSNNVSIISKRVIQSRKSSFLIIKMMTYWTRRALLANCLSV